MKEFVERGSTRRWGRTAVMLLLALIMATSNGWAFAAAAEEDVLAEETVPPLTAETAKEFLDSFFMMSELENEYVGATVAIVRDGETIALRGFGYADKENGIEVDPTDTVFRVASVSKTFVAAAIMQLVEQGIVDLQADIREYIPDLQFDNPFDVPVTVEHLLLHKSGLQVKDPHLHDDILTDSSVYYGIEEYVHEHMPPVVRLPGSAYMYDNFAYLLLGLIVQEASGVPFVEYMENAIFKPLGMTNSSFSPRGPIIEQLANGYDASQQPLDFYVLKPTDMPHGGMFPPLKTSPGL